MKNIKPINIFDIKSEFQKINKNAKSSLRSIVLSLFG